MWRVYAVVALVWLALSPPLFTGGACTDEFANVERRLVEARPSLFSLGAAPDYLRSQGWPTSVITPDRCREAKPRFLDRCGASTYVYAKAPVKSWICSMYRDSDVKVLLEYNDRGQLLRLRTDMAPFKSLPIPLTQVAVHWAR